MLGLLTQPGHPNPPFGPRATALEPRKERSTTFAVDVGCYSDFLEGLASALVSRMVTCCKPMVTDQLDIKHCGEITLYIDRSPELIHKKRKPQQKRRNLFDEVDVDVLAVAK